MRTRQASDEELIERRVLHLNAVATALGVAVICGLGLFAATMILTLRGGAYVGEHLGLLAQYLPGYTVSIGGAFLGLAYAGVIGGVAAFLIAAIYNQLARRA